jgi:putative oxidoreductase
MADATIDPKRLVFPGLAGLYQSLSPYAYDFMRFSAGAVLVPHGVQKIFFKSIGALCLAIGLFTRLAALLIGIEMSVIIVVFQWQYGYFWTDRGVEYALLWWPLCLAIFFRGGGAISVDRLLGKEL